MVFEIYIGDNFYYSEQTYLYDFKNLILDMLEQMNFQDKNEYEIVCGWSYFQSLYFMKKSSLLPYNLLIEINNFTSLSNEELLNNE